MTASHTYIASLFVVLTLAGASPILADDAGPASPALRRATRQSQFTIPFSLDRPSEEVTAVRLFVSVDQGKTWQVANSQPPSAGKFAFRAPSDGVYLFASRTIDRQLQAWPQEPLRPELEVWVDTSQPQLELRPEIQGNQVKVSWSAWDPLLDARSLQLEYFDGRRWHTSELEPQRVGGRLQGVATTPIVARQFRVAASDQAGNRTVLSRELEGGGAAAAVARTPHARGTAGPKLPSGVPSDPLALFRSPATSAAARPPVASTAGVERLPATSPSTDPISAATDTSTRDDRAGWSPRSEPFASAPRQPWPQNNRRDDAQTSPRATQSTQVAQLASRPSSSKPSPFTSVPPTGIEYSAVAGQVAPPVAAREAEATFASSTWRRDEAPNGLTLPPTADTSQDARAESYSNGFDSPPVQSDGTAVPRGVRIQWTNRTRFNIDYQIDSILPEHVGDVELWATADGGRTWAKWGNDPDHVSPVSIKIEEPGVYGFHVVVVSRRGMASVTPKTPADADVWIGVDQAPPTAQLTSATIASGANAGRLNIQWTADDQHLDQRPIELFYGPSTAGPWTSIASDLENSGNYFWQPTPIVPEQIHLKLKATDQAGNVTEHVVPDTIRIESLRPRAMIRTMQPLQGASTTIHAETAAPKDREARAPRVPF